MGSGIFGFMTSLGNRCNFKLLRSLSSYSSDNPNVLVGDDFAHRQKQPSADEFLLLPG